MTKEEFVRRFAIENNIPEDIINNSLNKSEISFKIVTGFTPQIIDLNTIILSTGTLYINDNSINYEIEINITKDITIDITEMNNGSYIVARYLGIKEDNSYSVEFLCVDDKELLLTDIKIVLIVDKVALKIKDIRQYIRGL